MRLSPTPPCDGGVMFGVGESQNLPTAAHGIAGLDYDAS
jgi:hypothetical protein